MAYTYAGRWGPYDLGRLLTLDQVPNVLVAQPAFAPLVYLRNTQTKATLYTDRSKGTTAPNPATADSYGNLTIFADPGEYDLVANGLILPITVLADPAEMVQASSAGVAGGVATLDGGTHVPTAQLGSGAASSAVVLRGDQSWGQIADAQVATAAAIAQSKVANLVSDIAARALDSTVVHLTGNESIAGTKTFTGGSVALSAPNAVLDFTGGGFPLLRLNGKTAIQHANDAPAVLSIGAGYDFVVVPKNLGVGANAPSSGVGNIGLSDATTPPTWSFGSGGVLYSDASVPKWLAGATGQVVDLTHTPGVYLGTVASQAAMLALSSAKVGDWAIRSDLSATSVLTTAGPSTLAHWTQLPGGGGGGGGSAVVPWRRAVEFAATPAQASAFGVTGQQLSSFYGTLAAAQADYPHATSLNDFLDWAIIQAALNGSITSGAPSTTRRGPLNNLDLGAGTFHINHNLTLISVQGFRLFGEGQFRTAIQCHSLGSTVYGIELNGVSYSTFWDFTVYAADGTSGGAIHLHWDNTASLNSTTFVKFHDIAVASQGGDFANGIVLGDDNTLQNDSIVFEHLSLSGLWSDGNTTTWQKGLSLGRGGGGNTLDVRIRDCSIASMAYGVSSGGCNFHCTNFQHANNGVDFALNTPGGEYWIDGGRSEGAQRLAWIGTGGVTGNGSVAIRDVQFNANGLHADGKWIICNYSGLVLSNVTCSPDPRLDTLHGGGVHAVIDVNMAAVGTFSIEDLSVPETLDVGLLVSSEAFGTVSGWRQVDSSGNLVRAWGFRAYGGTGATPNNKAAEFRAAGTNTGFPIVDFEGQDGGLCLRVREGQIGNTFEPGMFFGSTESTGLRAHTNGLLDVCNLAGTLQQIRSKRYGAGISFGGGALTIDALQGEIFIINLSGNVTSTTINNLLAGQTIGLSFYHVGGPWTIAWPSGTQFCGNGGLSSPPVITNPNCRQSHMFVNDGFELIEISRAL